MQSRTSSSETLCFAVARRVGRYPAFYNISVRVFNAQSSTGQFLVVGQIALAHPHFGIRPIISLNAGVSKVEAKVRGDAAVPAAMIKWVESRVDSMKDTPYMVAYTSSTSKRDELVKACKKAFGHAPVIVFQLGGVVSANTGPDGIAIVYPGHPRHLEAYAPQLP